MNQIVPIEWQIDRLEAFSENSYLFDKVIKRLKTLGMPNAKMEHFRYFSIVSLLSKNYTLYEREDIDIEASDTIEIVDGELKKAPKFVELIKNQESFIADDHYDPIYYISHLLTKRVIKVQVNRDMKLKINHSFSKDKTLSSYRIVIDLGEGVELELDEEFIDLSVNESLSFYGLDIRVKEGAKLTWVRDQKVDESSINMIASHSLTLNKEAKAKVATYDFGASRVLHIYKIDLFKSSKLDIDHLIYSSHEAQRGNIIEINHKEESASTTQNARHILNDSSRAIFDALIRVDKSAKYAITHQNNQSILLQDGAYMISKPQLEIYIDELEASHGSTTGEINPSQFFYLQSRGIKKDEAKKMLIYAFAKDLIESLGIESIQKRVIEKFDKSYREVE